MTRFYSSLLVMLQLHSIVFANGAPALNREDSRERAEQLWELAIQAKGGRDHLCAVRSIVISQRSQPELVGSAVQVFRDETLYAFPDKYWAWEDWGDGTHLRVYMYDGSTEGYWFHERDMASAKKTDGGDETPRFYLFRDQVALLMETRWVRPVPVEARTEQIGKRTVDIVRTQAQRFLVDYYLDQHTHLPIAVEIIDPAWDSKVLDTIHLEDYQNFSGIRLPRKVRTARVSYQINMEYDEQVFKRPPSVDRGPSAWRRISSE